MRSGTSWPSGAHSQVLQAAGTGRAGVSRTDVALGSVAPPKFSSTLERHGVTRFGTRVSADVMVRCEEVALARRGP